MKTETVFVVETLRDLAYLVSRERNVQDAHQSLPVLDVRIKLENRRDWGISVSLAGADCNRVRVPPEWFDYTNLLKQALTELGIVPEIGQPKDATSIVFTGIPFNSGSGSQECQGQEIRH